MQTFTLTYLLQILFCVLVFSLAIHSQKAELIVQTGHGRDVMSVMFSPDGKMIASGSADHTICLWEAETGAEIRTLAGHTDAVLAVAFSPDGKKIASTSWDNTIRLWDLETGAEIKKLVGHADEVEFVAFSPDGKRLASGGWDRAISLWDVQTGAQIRKFVGHTGAVNSVVFSPDGKMIASGGSDSTIRLWDAKTGAEIRTLAGHTGAVNSVVFSPDGKRIASGSWDRAIRLWDVQTGAEVRTLAGHADAVVSVVFSPDGKKIASGSEDNTIRLWDVETGAEVGKLEGHTELIYSAAFSPDGKKIASASLDGIRLWDVETRVEIRKLDGHTGAVNSVAFSPDGKIIASASADNTIRLWKTGKEIGKLAGHTGAVKSVAFSPDGKKIASGSSDDTIRLWDTETGAEIRTLAGHISAAFSVAFSPDGKKIASGSWDGPRLWDTETGAEIRKFAGRTDSVFSVAFSPDGKMIASVSNNTIHLWDVETGVEIKKLVGHTDAVNSVSFSPDGKMIASGSKDDTIRLWDAKTGAEIRKFAGHNDQVIEVAFSPDGKRIVSGSEDNTIGLWDAETGAEIRKLDGRTGAVNAITFSPDGMTLLSGGSGGNIQLWNPGTGDLIISLIALDESDWAVVTPGGLFDASPGARKLMHYVVGLEPISLEQMKDVYYVPGLLQKIFKGEPLPKVELFSKKDLFPLVEYEPLKPGQKQLKLKLTDRGGAIGQVQVLVNGKEFIKDARPAGFDPNSANAALTVDLSNAAIKPGEENKIEIIARNAAGSLSTRGTRGAEIFYTDAGRKQTETPNVYVIAGGISNYTGDNLKLNFAAKDAEDFARAIEVGATKLIGDKGKVHIRLLTSSGDRSGMKLTSPDAKISTATKSDFQNAFNDFKTATPNDVFIVYLAGHGVSLNLNQNPNQAGGDTYLYLTQEATTTDKAVLSVENSRKAMAISSDEIKDLMKQNKALKQVLILDTCAAGALSNSLVGKRDLPSDQIRAIERLKDSTGFFVLMGASADAVSYEASQYGQGLLTYALLQGMKGARLRENQFADVGMLFGYAQETVPSMAKNIGGIQRPLIITPDTSSSFDIGKFTTEERAQIALSSPKPVILRPSLRNSALRFDNLKLTQMLTEALRHAAYIQTRGGPGPIVFVDVDEMIDGFQPVGDYTIEGDLLKISLILVKNNAPVGREITVTGKASEAEIVIKQLVETIMKSQ